MKSATRNKSVIWRRLASVVRWSLRLLLMLIIFDIAYMASIWPDWDSYRSGPIQRSNFIRDYEIEQKTDPELPRLQWQPVSLNRIPKTMVRAVIVAEDSRFYSHDGIDLEAFKSAMQYNLDQGRMIYGASTISQQTAKNLFLNPSRNPLRKWHELVLTLAMERELSKNRIMEHYLNVAQFGRGLFGVEAAARHYWGIPASRLTRRQAIELAASLPSPVSTNPAARNRTFLNRVRKIERNFTLSSRS